LLSKIACTVIRSNCPYMDRVEITTTDLLCAGKLYVDVLFTGLPRFPVPGEEILSEDIAISLGGGAAICAVGVSRLGLKTSVTGAIVPGLFGDYIVHTLAFHNVKVDALVKVHGTENNISVSLDTPDDRSMIAFAGIDDHSELDNRKRDTVLSTSHLHVKGLNQERAELLKFAKENNRTTSLDINLQTASNVETLWGILPYVDVFLPSAWEVKALFNSPPGQMVKKFGKQTGSYSVIKLGREGSIASDGNSLIEQPSRSVKIVDATGAGDAYNAGFLWAYLRKEPIEQCLRAGTLAAELCLQTVGGIGWVNRVNEFFDSFGNLS
jgi:sugar/nucleoside kinase (ribokinase family)